MEGSMAKFMLILGGADLDKRSGSPNYGPVLDSYISWVTRLKDEKRYVTGNKLYDQTGVRLTVRGGVVVDGPFVETKESIGGFFIIEADTLEEATTVANPVSRYPNALAAYAELHASLGHLDEARDYLVRALQHQPSRMQRALLERKLTALGRSQASGW
jgi:hypothetical protein